MAGRLAFNIGVWVANILTIIAADQEYSIRAVPFKMIWEGVVQKSWGWGVDRIIGRGV